MKTQPPSLVSFRVLPAAYIVLFGLSLLSGCSVAEPATSTNAKSGPAANTDISAEPPAPASKGATIDIEPNGPADTVRAFYTHLRERRFREAIFLTNLRPAVEGLTETELNEFALDFEAIAGRVPPQIEINGEIVTGDQATVTANLPSLDDDDKNETQPIKLRRDDGVWRIMTADDEAARQIKRDGNRYFYNLRITTHEDEAEKMLERISKAQLAHSLQNGGLFTEMAVLIGSGLLPEDIADDRSTGYNYAIKLADGGKNYTATATPAVYGKSGRRSFLLRLDAKGISHVSGKDVKGSVLTR